jgi:hypothetical protein
MAEGIDEEVASPWRLPRTRGPNAGWWHAPLAATATVVVGVIGAALSKESVLGGVCAPAPHESQGVVLFNIALYLLTPFTVVVGAVAIRRGSGVSRLAGAASVVVVVGLAAVLLATNGDYYCSR